mmetsp:Transcript_19854/g.32947  ORF Transcript_19854/g.32947 Transcript_19854/m.32947 type:complete len:104 (+) Transcript_19854:130-441(+)
MARFTITAALLVATISSAAAFTAPRPIISRTSTLFAEEDPTERGVSVDQDGKSNVWAIEPKMEVDTKSSEEKTSSVLLGAGALAAFAVGAGVVLTNLPDPNQF